MRMPPLLLLMLLLLMLMLMPLLLLMPLLYMCVYRYMQDGWPFLQLSCSHQCWCASVRLCCTAQC